MRLFEFLFPKGTSSAAVARERLQLVLAHERLGRGSVDFLPALQRDLLAAVRNYVEAGEDTVEVKLGRNGTVSILEISIELPSRKIKRAAPMPPQNAMT
jgi:cell division topological specificity factor